MGGWHTTEHTADLALEAWGATGAEALEELCRGLLAQVTDLARVRASSPVEIRAEGMDLPETLVTALGELLYWVNTRQWLFREFRVGAFGDRQVHLTAWGEPRDPRRQPFHLEVKAATYHGLRFDPPGGGRPGRLRVLFDV